jgi:6-pyruvoyl-tetrahydropterin synthase
MKSLEEHRHNFQFVQSMEALFVASHKHYGEILHGHNFRCRVTVLLSRPVFSRVCFKQVIQGLDYQHLNRLPYFRKFTPSTENIAQFIADSMSSLGCDVREVEVFETEGCSGGIICGS